MNHQAIAIIHFKHLGYSGIASLGATACENFIHNPVIVFDALFYKWSCFPDRTTKLDHPFPIDEKELRDHITDLADNAWVITATQE